MTFGNHELRLGMDVFSADGVLLGSVVQIRRRPRQPRPPPDDAFEVAASAFSGEALGPMPTASLGNTGPSRQLRAAHYATDVRPHTSASPTEPAALLVFRTLVHLDWRTLWPRLRRYPVSLIQHVSHERIVLSGTAAEIDRL